MNLSTGVDNPLFLYPANTIEQIGNIVTNIGGSLLISDSSTNAFWGYSMFNVTLGGGQWSYANAGAPMYKLGAPINSKNLTIGYVSSYKLNSPCFDWSTLAPYVKKLSYTFYKASGIPPANDNTITFDNIEEIGDGSFYCDSTYSWGNIKIGQSCSKIGTSAFNNFNAPLRAGGVNDGGVTFNNVTHIYASAFSQLTRSHEFYFTNL